MTLNYCHASDTGIETLSISFQLPVKTCSSVAPIKTQAIVPNTKFTVDFSFISLVSKNLSTFQQKKNGEWVEHCTWFFKENILTIEVDSAGFREGHLLKVSPIAKVEKDSCRVFFAAKSIVEGVQSVLKVFAPKGYLEERRKTLRQSESSCSPPAPAPVHVAGPQPDTGVAREFSYSTSSSRESPSPFPPFSLDHRSGKVEGQLWGINSISSSAVYEACDLWTNSKSKSYFYNSVDQNSNKRCCFVDESNPRDVVLSVRLPNSRVAEETGHALEHIAFNLVVIPAQSHGISTTSESTGSSLSEKPSSTSDADGQFGAVGCFAFERNAEVCSPWYNVKAVLAATGSVSEPLELKVHFDSTVSRPCMAASRSALGNGTSRCRFVVIAECKDLRCGEILLNFGANRCIVFPSEEEVYAQIKEIHLSGALPRLTTETLDQYARHMEMRNSLIFNLCEEDIEDFQMILWSALRRYALEGSKF